MIRTLTCAAALTTALAFPAAAFDPAAMTDTERAAFGEAVRDYLLSNPSLLREMIDAMQQAEAGSAALADADMVRANADAIFEDGWSHVGGNPDGDITVVEFLDYRCGYCRKAHPEVAELVASDGQIRKIIKELPILGPESIEAARFAISVQQVAGEEAYSEVSDALMEHRGEFTREAMARLADDQGLDTDAVLARMDDDAVSGVIAANHALANALQISGTPTFVMGETMVRGYAPLEAMREIVAAERAE